MKVRTIRLCAAVVFGHEDDEIEEDYKDHDLGNNAVDKLNEFLVVGKAAAPRLRELGGNDKGAYVARGCEGMEDAGFVCIGFANLGYKNEDSLLCLCKL